MSQLPTASSTNGPLECDIFRAVVGVTSCERRVAVSSATIATYYSVECPQYTVSMSKYLLVASIVICAPIYARYFVTEYAEL